MQPLIGANQAQRFSRLRDFLNEQNARDAKTHLKKVSELTVFEAYDKKNQSLGASDDEITVMGMSESVTPINAKSKLMSLERQYEQQGSATMNMAATVTETVEQLLTHSEISMT